MTPLPQNPKITLLVKNGQPIALATNVSPDLDVVITHTQEDFDADKKGMPFSADVEAPVVMES